MNAIQQIKAILEGAGRRVYYIRDAVFTASWLVQNCEFPAVLLFERRLRTFQHEGVGAWRELCECKMVCVTTTAYEFQTPENDAIQETQTTDALSLCSLLRQSQMFDRFEVGQALAVYDGAIGVLLTGCSVDLTASTLAGECGTPPDAGKIITENGRFNVLGLSWVDVQVQGAGVIEPLTVTPTYDEQTITPTPGVDGFAPVVVGACPVCPAPVVEALQVTPTTEPQTLTPSAGVDGYDEVNVSAVTAAIDANITPVNIKQGVDILGVTGTMEQGVTIDGGTYTGQTIDPFVLMQYATTAADAQSQSAIRNNITEVDDDNITTLGSYSFSYCPNLRKIRCINATTMASRFQQESPTEELILPSITAVPSVGIREASELRIAVFGALTTWNSNAIASQTTAVKMRHFEVGAGTAVALVLSRWTATDVIAEGQDAIDELNYNIKTYLADKVADRTNDSALTITFGASLYNVLTADTIAAFTAKNWSVASA